MANLQIKGIDDRLYEELKELAAKENRSVSQQVLFLIRALISRKKSFQASKSAAQTLLELSGSWHDLRESDEIVGEIRKSRKDSKKLKKGF